MTMAANSPLAANMKIDRDGDRFAKEACRRHGVQDLILLPRQYDNNCTGASAKVYAYKTDSPNSADRVFSGA